MATTAVPAAAGPVWYPCQTRSYFILRKLHELDPARFNTVMTNLYHEQEKKPQDITKVESGPEGIKDVQVKMGKWR